MYASIGYLEKYAKKYTNRPLIMCEYDHAMGNSVGALYDYWQVIEEIVGCKKKNHLLIIYIKDIITFF